MSIHPEDLRSYADDMHRDLGRIAEALERIAEVLYQSLDDDHVFRTRSTGVQITREDRE